MQNQAPLPQRPRAHQLDEAASLALKMSLQPHIVEDSNLRDYAKDLRVKLVDASAAAHAVTGKEFSSQAKGTDSPLETNVVVHVKNLASWFNSHEPVMVAKVFSLGSAKQSIWAVWIDAELRLHLSRRSPEWRKQQTVTLPLKFEIKPGALEAVERFANDWRGASSDAWDPGEFASVEREAQTLAAELLALSSGRGIEGPVATLRQAAKQLMNLSYAVALLGSSRVGKSTLLNRLLGRDLSPVDDLPTTAVVMSVSAGDDETATVHFLDGKSVTGQPYIIAYGFAPSDDGGEEVLVVLRVVHTARDWPPGRWPRSA